MPGPVAFDAWTLDIDIRPAFTKLKKFPEAAKVVGKQMADNLTKPVMTRMNMMAKRIQRTLGRRFAPVVRNLQDQFKWLTTGRGAFEIKVDEKKAVAKLDNFERAMKSFWGKVQHYLTFTIGVQLVMKSVRALQQTIQLFTEFERNVAMAASVSGYFGKAFGMATDVIEKFARTVGKKTVYSANEVAEAMYSIASAGYDVMQFGEEDLIPMLNYAAAQGVELNYAVEQILRTFKEFGDQGETTASIVDKFTAAITSSFLNAKRLAEGMKYVGAMAGSVGVSLDETLAALAALVDRGYEGSQAGQRLNMILTRLLKPTREGEKVLQKLGLTIADVDPRVHSLVEILYTLRAAGFSAADAAQMFRARTAAAALTLVDNADAVAMFAGRLSAAQGITEELAEKQIQTLWGAMRLLHNSLIDLSLSIGHDLKPAIVGFADAIKNYLIPVSAALISPVKYTLAFLSGFGTATRKATSFVTALAITFGGLIISMKLFSKLLPIINTGILEAALTTTRLSKGLIMLGNVSTQAISKLTGLSLSSKALAQTFGLVTASSLVLFSAFSYKLPSALSTVISYFTTLYILLGTLRNRVMSLRDGLITFGAMGISAVTAGIAQQANTIEDKLIPGLISIGSAAVGTAYMLKVLGVTLTSLTGIIGIVIAIVSVLVSVFKDELVNAFKTAGKALGIIPTEAELISRKLPEVTEAVNELNESMEKWQEITKQIADIRKEIESFSGSVDELRSKMEELNQLQEDQSAYQLQVFEAWNKLMSVSSNMTEVLGKDIKLVKEWVELQIKEQKLQKRSEELTNEQTRALDQYNEAVLKAGARSEEAVSAWNRYYTVGEDLGEVLKEIDQIHEDLKAKEADHADKLRKMTDAEREYAQAIWEVAGKYVQAIQLMDDLTQLYAKLNTLSYIRTNINKVLAEKFANLADSEKRVLDIEERLYKLRHDAIKRVRDLWDQLAKEGWITDDLIEGRKDLEKSYGKMMKAQIKFTAVLSRLAPKQREELFSWLEDYQQALEKGVKPPAPPEFLAPEEAEIAVEYANSLATYREAIERLESSLKTFVSSLVDSDVASSELADKYYDLVNVVNEIAQASNKLQETLSGQDEKFSSIVETIWNYWRSIYQSSDETSNIEGAFMEAARGLGIFTDALDDSDKMLEYIRIALGDQTITWDNLTEEQAVAALTIGKVGDAYLGLYKAMLSNDIMSLIPGVDSWDGFISAVEKAYDLAIPKISEIRSEIESTYSELKKLMSLSGATIAAAKSKIRSTKEKMTRAAIIKGAATGAAMGAILGPAGMIGGSIGGVYKAMQEAEKISKAADKIINTANKLEAVSSNARTKFGEVLSSHAEKLINKAADEFAKGNLKNAENARKMVSKITNVISKYKLAKGGLIRKPGMALVGEAGPELVIPLTDRRRAIELLSKFLPRYLPEATAQAGGFYGHTTPVTATTYSESWTITGPIHIHGVMDVDAFLNELKYRARLAAPV